MMSKASPQIDDAVDLLDADHVAFKKMFAEFKKLCEAGAPGDDKKALADKICMDLTVHAELEEQIFYPAARDAINEDGLLNEAEVKHASAKDLIGQIWEMDPEEDLFDAKVAVLGQYIDHHVEEERNEIFVKARKSDMDLHAMVEEFRTLKGELMLSYEN